MTKAEIKELIESRKPGYKCKHCVWGRKITNDPKNDIYNVMCLFPKCIKENKDKKC